MTQEGAEIDGVLTARKRLLRAKGNITAQSERKSIMSNREDMERLDHERAEFECERLAQDVTTGALTVAAATLGGPVTAVAAVGIWALKTIIGKNERDREWGDD